MNGKLLINIHFLGLCLTCAFEFLSVFPAHSQGRVIPIIGYDIQNAAESGFGNWYYYYGGTITPTGSNIVVYPDPGGTATLANLTGGSGTLNDGQVGLGNFLTELFVTEANPVITIYLANTCSIQSINLQSWCPYNEVPGNIVSVVVTVNGVSRRIQATTTQDGVTNVVNTLLDLTVGPLAKLTSNTVTLSGITTTGAASSVFCIGQIIVVATVAPPILTNCKILSNGAFQFRFDDIYPASFTVLTTTNPSLPLTNWTAVGAPSYFGFGEYRFTDLTATNGGQRFYRVSSP